MQAHVQERVAIAAPPEAVWRAATDWGRQSEWVALTTVTVAPGGHRVGERLTAVTKLAGAGFADPMEVTRWEPPHRAEVAHRGRVVRGSGTFLVAPAPGGAWLTWREDLELPFGVLGGAAFALARPAARLFLRRSLRRLARLVEAEAAAGRVARGVGG